MSGRIVNPDQYRRMPWKNGGGETVEIAIFPRGADLDDFGWRVSTATVGSDGPFSTFEGIDRTLCILSGNGISLAVGNDEPLTLDRDSAPFSFPADGSAVARLVDGPITDLNVMTRRTDWRHDVRRLHMRADEILALKAAAARTVVFCQTGAVRAEDGTDASTVRSGATLLIERDMGSWTLRATEPSTIFVVAIEPAGA
jgi:environmental stress-induced protein Ves